jgi:hypothetical protein
MNTPNKSLNIVSWQIILFFHFIPNFVCSGADQAFSSLFAAIAHKKLKEFARPIQEEFGDCSKVAKTVVAHAQCVSDLFSGKIDGRKYIEKVGTGKEEAFKLGRI